VTDQHPPVRLILDRSALLAYVAGSVHVAEPLHEVLADGVAFGVPLPVAAEVLAAAAGNDLVALHRLFDNPACVLLTGEADGLPELVFWRRLTGSLDRAVCAVAALAHEASILTADGKLYGPDLPIIDVPG
jgi:hypothetical protein